MQDSPLLQFDCGHSILMSNTDAMFEMVEICYDKDSHGNWQSAKPLDDNSLQIPKCPTCKVPLTGIQRYNRRINWVNLNKSGLKYNKKVEAECSNFLNQIAEFAKHYEGLFDKVKERPSRQTLPAKMSKLAKELKKLELPASQHPLLLANSVIQRQDMLPTSVNTDASSFEKAKASLAAEYIKMLVGCLQYRVSFDPSSKQPANRSMKIITPADLDIIGERIETLYRESITLSLSGRKRLGQVKVMLLDLSYRMQLRNGLPKLYDTSDLPELDTIKRIHSLFRQTLEERPSKILAVIEDLERSAPSPELLKMKGQVEAFSRCLSSEATAAEHQMIFDAMRSDVGSAMGSFGGHWYCCPNGHPYSIGECGGAMEQSTCPECGETIGGSNHRLANSNKVYEPLARKQFGYVRST
jgi:hypothetical protein